MGYAVAQKGLGRVLAQVGQHDEARMSLQKALPVFERTAELVSATQQKLFAVLGSCLRSRVVV